MPALLTVEPPSGLTEEYDMSRKPETLMPSPSSMAAFAAGMLPIASAAATAVAIAFLPKRGAASGEVGRGDQFVTHGEMSFFE